MKNFQNNSGYTMVIFLAFIVAILLAGFSLYDNGIVAAERMRMQNTADATAYSTMTVLSRDMNFIAYTNRGMVANQVAVGQMVGLSSWMHMIDQTASNLDTVATFTYLFPPVGVWVNRVTSLLEQATAAGVTGIDIFAKGGIIASDILNYGLSKGQLAFQGMTADMAIATYKEVAKANDEDIEHGIVGPLFAFATLIRSWKEELEYNDKASRRNNAGDRRKRKRYGEFAGVVNDSRDPFTRDRSHDWISKVSVANIGVIQVKMAVLKKGGSDFLQTSVRRNNLQWQWSAMDTVSFWGYFKWWQLGWGHNHWHTSDTEMLPIGWGAAHALNNQRSNSSSNYFNYSGLKNDEQLTYYDDGKHKAPAIQSNKKHWGAAWNNPMAATTAAYDDGNNNLTNGQGLQPFHDLKSDTQKDTGPSLVVMLTKKRNKLRLEQTIDDTDTNYNRTELMSIEQYGSIAGNTIYGLSKAETYFSRPKDLWERNDGLREYGNLYNPFWQTRLIDNENVERLAASALQTLN